MPRSPRFKRKQSPVKLISKNTFHNNSVSKNNSNGNNGRGKLTPKQERFAIEYLVDLNATQAAIRAGYSNNGQSAEVQGCMLLRNPKVNKYIQKRREKLSVKAEINEEWVLKRYKLLADYNVYDFFQDDGELRPLSTIPKEKLYAVCGIKVAKRITTQTDLEAIEKTIIQEFKLPDKRAVLDSIGKYLGMFEKDNEQKRQPMQINVMVTD